ncbi:MAG: HEAT repeat domain-containing protein [Planctomycetota bacterium]|jgi:hypothetical protein
MRRLLLLAALFALPARAQETPEKPPPKPKPAPEAVLHEIRLGSGTTLVGKVEPRQLRVLTKFGTLTVPIESLKLVKFGRKAHPERYESVLALINELASANPDLRNAAVSKLKKEGSFAAPELHRAARRHEDPEVRRRAQEILDAIGVDEDDYIADHDEVATTLFSVSGAVIAKSFKVAVKELGSVNVERRDIVSMRLFKGGHSRKFKINGKYTMATGWHDTKIVIKRGVRLRIRAEGQMTWPRWNQIATPDGNPNMGNINGIWLGALTGRVGDGGQMFKIGRGWSGTPQGKGTLHLCVMMNQKNQPYSGEFVVSIEEE